MSIFLPDYNHCTVNLACSVLEEFGAKRPRHKTLDAADRLLQTKYHKNIVLLVLDAMGQSVLEDHLAPDGFFRQHLITVYSSIFPSTTAAATTSLDSALCPSEHGWLGWNCYFSEIDRTVTVLLNRDAATGESITDYHVARTYCPYKTIHERIRETGAAAYFSMPYIAPYPPTFPKVCERVQELCALDGHKYIYAYWDEPDNTMHTTGCDSKCSRDKNLFLCNKQQTQFFLLLQITDISIQKTWYLPIILILWIVCFVRRLLKHALQVFWSNRIVNKNSNVYLTKILVMHFG